MPTYALRAGFTTASVGVIFIDSERTLDLQRTLIESETHSFNIQAIDELAVEVLDEQVALTRITFNPTAPDAKFYTPVFALVGTRVITGSTLVRRSDGLYEDSPSGGGFGRVADVASLPATGNTDGDIYEVMTLPRSLYTWVEGLGEWQQLASGTGGGGGGGTGDDDVPNIGTDLATLGEGSFTGRPGLLILGDDPAASDDFDLLDLWWIGSRWVSREENIGRSMDTWARDLSNYSAASRSGYQRPTEPISYGRGHAFLTSNVTVGATSVPINNGTSFTIAPFQINQYTVTPTGFSGSAFTGCAWSPSGTGEVLPQTITLVRQGAVGGYGWVPRTIHRIGELYAKGFAIQCRASAFMVGSSDSHALTIGTYLLNYNVGDDVPAIASTPTAGLGMLTQLTGPASDNGAANREQERAMAMVSAAWSDLSGVSTPTKEFAYPVDYGKMSAAGDTGEFYNHELWYRVVST